MTTIHARSGDGLAAVGQDAYTQPDGTVLPVLTSINKIFRSEFMGTSLNAAKWDVSQTGAGMSYSVANGALALSMGTTIDDEVAFTSKEAFTLPCRAIVGLSLSQRIAGQSVYVELVSVNADSGLADGQYAAAWELSNTTATNGYYHVQAAGNPRLVSNGVTTQTTATPVIFEIEAFHDQFWFHSRALNNASARPNSCVRDQQLPDSNSLYKLRVRARNRQALGGITAVANNGSGAVRITRAVHNYTTGDSVTVENVAGVPGANGTFTVTAVDANNFDLQGSTFSGAYINTGWATASRNLAPATNTVLSVAFASVVDHAELTAEISAGRGSSSTGQSVSVNANLLSQSATSLNVGAEVGEVAGRAGGAFEREGGGLVVDQGGEGRGGCCHTTIVSNRASRPPPSRQSA